MNSYLLGLYVLIIIIRPMDWWEPVLDWQFVYLGSILLSLVGAPTLLSRFRVIWQQIPQLKIAILLWIGLILSFASQINFHGTLWVFQDFGKVIYLFILLLVLIVNLKASNLLLLALLVGATFLAIHAILQHHTGAGFGGKPPSPRTSALTGEVTFQARAFGTLDDPNDLCLLLVVCIPLFYVLVKTTTNPFQKIFAFTGSALCTYGAWCTNSRGGVIAAFGMIGAYLMVRMRGVKRYLTAAFAFSAVTVLAPSRFGGGLVGRDRSMLWGDGLDMFKSNPLFGVGYGRFSDLSNDHHVAHNSFVHVLAESGLAGYLPFFLLLYLTMIHLRRLMNQKKIISKSDFYLLSGIFAALAGDYTAMYFLSRQYQHILYVLLAIAITQTYLLSIKYDLRSHVFGPVKKDVRMGLFLGLGSVVVLWISIRIVNQMS